MTAFGLFLRLVTVVGGVLVHGYTASVGVSYLTA